MKKRDGKPPVITIVGAGPGGLASAMLLASTGAKVRIIERRERVGGRTGAIESGGFRFDIGPTFFLYPRVLEEIFASVGRDLFRDVPMTRLDPQYRLVFGAGGQLDATPDVARMEAEIAKFAPKDAKSFSAFMNENRTKLEKFRPILESPFSSVADLFRPSTLQALPWLKPWRSVGSELEKYFSDPRLVIAFSFQSKYLGMSPFQCPSLFTILAFLEYEYGIFHPQGGCSMVSEVMADIARDMGVEIILDESVQSIQFEGRRATGVTTERETYQCDALIVNSDFSRSMQSMVPDRLRRRWTDEKLKSKKYSCSTFMLYLGIEGRYDDLAHHSIYIAEDYDRNLAEIESQHILSEDPSLYVQNASITDDTLAPSGHSTLYVLVPVTHMHENVDWNQERTPFRDRAIQQLGELGLDDIESRIRFEKVVTPADWDQDHQIHLGATFNLAHNLGQMLHKRPHNRFEDLEGVYLVGGGTHPGSGLPVIYESARITSKLICQDFDLQVATAPEVSSDALAAKVPA